MKRILLSLALIICVFGLYAQKSNVSKAKNKALSTTPDFAGALEDIKPALTDATTKDDQNTWYVAGLIGYKENEAMYVQMTLGKTVDQAKKGEAIVSSYKYLLVADSLGQIPDAKGKVKNKVRKDVVKYIKEYYSVPANLIGYGAELYDQKKYDEAYNVFNIYLGIPALPVMSEETFPVDSMYLQIKYYAGLAASNAGLRKDAIDLFKYLITKDYEKKNVYQLLYQEYFDLKDTVNYVNTLKAGFESYPAEPWFLQNLINFYIFNKQESEAVKYLDNAIANEPTVAQYRYVKGVLDERLNKFDEAEVSFNKALELDPNMADAYAGKGRLIFNKAVQLGTEAEKIKDNKLYNAEMEKADKIFKESIPLFKKAEELAPKELDYKQTLRTLYYRLGMDAEYKAMDEKIKEMQ